MDEVKEVRDALDSIAREYDLQSEHKALLALARAALARWSEVKTQLDAMGGTFETEGRYTGSTKVTPLLNVEVKLRAATLLTVEKLARLLS